MVDTTPRFRLSCARDCDSATPRHTRPKSRSDSWQPRTDSSRTLFSFRLSHMSLISAQDSASPVIWIEPGSISVVSSSVNGHYGSWRSDPRRLIRCTGLGISRKVWWGCCCCLLQRFVRMPHVAGRSSSLWTQDEDDDDAGAVGYDGQALNVAHVKLFPSHQRNGL